MRKYIIPQTAPDEGDARNRRRESQAENLYAELKKLDEQEVIYLEDAVFVIKNYAGEFKVGEKVHPEKRSRMVKGAALGTLIGWMLGGPLIGLAGGAVAGVPKQPTAE